MAEDWEDFFNQDEQRTSHLSVNSSRSSRRRTRARRKRTHPLFAWMLVIVIVAAIAFVGYKGAVAFRRYMNEQNAPTLEDWPGPGEGSVVFSVEDGQGAVEIGDRLVKANVIRSQALFTSTVAANNKILYPGTYQLKRHMATIDVVNILADYRKAGGFLEVRAGDRVRDVITRAAAFSKIDQGEFNTIVNNGGSGILPSYAHGSFEGWLEPGSYNVHSMKSAKEILSAMVAKRIKKLDSLGVAQGEQRQRILTIASIVEAEVNKTEYYGKVARVVENRLAANMPLGMDSTVAYGAGVAPAKITQAMLDNANDPYNTRIHKGLPPTPISSPSDKAIEAAMNPPAGKWLYFVTTNLTTGETKFADNEHDFWVLRDEYKRSNKNAN